MALDCINPAGLPVPSAYSHVVVATGSRLVFVAGQVAEDAEGAIIDPAIAASTWPPSKRAGSRCSARTSPPTPWSASKPCPAATT